MSGILDVPESEIDSICALEQIERLRIDPGEEIEKALQPPEELRIGTALNLNVQASGGVEAVVELMQQHPADISFQERGMSALWESLPKVDRSAWNKIAQSPPDKQALIDVLTAHFEKGVMNVILHAIGVLEASPEISYRGCHLIWLLGISPSNKGKMGVMGAAEVALEAMRRHPLSAEVQRAGCEAMRGLSVNDENEVRIVGLGGLETILSAMMQFPGHTDIQEAGCGAISNLSANASHLHYVASRRGIEAVLDAMKQHPASAEVQMSGFGVLKNLAENAEILCMISSKGGVDAVLSAMRLHISHPKVQVAGCEMIVNFSCHPESLAELARMDILKSIATALKNHPQNCMVQEIACHALSVYSIQSNEVLSLMMPDIITTVIKAHEMNMKSETILQTLMLLNHIAAETVEMLKETQQPDSIVDFMCSMHQLLVQHSSDHPGDSGVTAACSTNSEWLSTNFKDIEAAGSPAKTYADREEMAEMAESSFKIQQNVDAAVCQVLEEQENDS
jgi:hypothetical protein